MKNIIRKAGSFLFLIILTLSLFGCSKTEDSSKNNEIPQDGIIKAEKFKEIKDSEDIAFFNGENNDFSYQWMFIGSDIDKPKDINLLVESTDKNIEKVKEQTNSEVVKGFIFKETTSIDYRPSLSITLDKAYDISSADIYKYNENDKTLSKVSGSTVQSSSKSIINFSVLDREGEFYIVGLDPKGDNIEQNSDESKDTENKTDTNKESTKDIKEETITNTNQSTSQSNEKDKYLTDPVPEGKPAPVEPEDTEVDKSEKKYVTLSIRCDTLLKPENYKIACDNGKQDMIPSNGVIYGKKKVVFYEGESVFDVLLREMKNSKIHMEHEFTPMYNSAYIEGINNLYEFDGGELSGWVYKVNEWFPNYGCSRYQLKEGDVIEWLYTCDLGRDVGCEGLGNKYE